MGGKGCKFNSNKTCLKTKLHKSWQNLPHNYFISQNCVVSNIFTEIYLICDIFSFFSNLTFRTGWMILRAILCQNMRKEKLPWTALKIMEIWGDWVYFNLHIYTTQGHVLYEKHEGGPNLISPRNQQSGKMGKSKSSGWEHLNLNFDEYKKRPKSKVKHQIGIFITYSCNKCRMRRWGDANLNLLG